MFEEVSRLFGVAAFSSRMTPSGRLSKLRQSLFRKHAVIFGISRQLKKTMFFYYGYDELLPILLKTETNSCYEQLDFYRIFSTDNRINLSL